MPVRLHNLPFPTYHPTHHVVLINQSEGWKMFLFKVNSKSCWYTTSLRYTCLSEVVYIFLLIFRAGSLPNFDVSHHLEMNGNSVTSKHPTQGWQSFIPVLPTFAGTLYTPWSSEAMIYWDTTKCLYPPRGETVHNISPLMSMEDNRRFHLDPYFK